MEQDANGHHGLTYFLERLDGKVDTIIDRLGEGRAVMRQQREDTKEHGRQIAELQTKVSTLETATGARPSRLKVLVGALRDIMPLKEWFAGAVVVTCSLVGIKMPAEAQAFFVKLLGLTGGGP